ncbi:DNA polymerase III subunit alpha [Bacillus mexicanus]|uniref:DNA polymerase III subunit alpha n=1 Tax=Bacillus mexicanus TaxID=2834415 RepID=UPI003D1938B7
MKTKYSLENNIDPLALLKRSKEMNIKTILIADQGPFSWLEIEKWNKDYEINVLYSIHKERNGVNIIWIPKGDVLRQIAKLEKSYREKDFSNIGSNDFVVLLDPNTVTKKEIIEKELDTLKWLKSSLKQVYILDKQGSKHNFKILKEKSGVHPITIKEVMYLDPTERDISLMRRAIKTGKMINDDYRSFILPLQYLKKELGTFEFNRLEKFMNGIHQDFIVEGHKEFKEKKMEYWNVQEIEKTKIPKDWNRFFNKQIKIPTSIFEQKKLALLCYKAGLGFNKRYKNEDLHIKEHAINRLKQELGVIAEKGFYTYFLMVEDFIAHCIKMGILVGRGRGSVVGSVLAYCLNITEINPVYYDLKFERFLNPYRSNKPDIDLDFAPSQIELIFKYVREKYGIENVSKILTFNTFGVINAIQSIKNALGISEKIETWFPKGLENLDDFFNSEEGRQVKSKVIEKGYGKILEYVSGIAELPQALSIHPAGVIISQELNQLPLILRDGELVLPFTKHEEQIERLGVIKFDFLKVKTLDVVKETVEIRKSLNKPLYDIDFEDKKTFDLYRSGHSIGVFQMKSYGMRKTCIEAKPNSIQELMDIISLYRPGPMEEIPRYVDNKEKGKWSFDKLDPDSSEFKDIVPMLDQTHGIIIYQEQIIEMASVWAGYTLGEADLLRRAISEKNKEMMKKEKLKFVERSLLNNREKNVTEYIYNLILKFSDYGFNKSHAGGYAMFSFETAFYKAHYPVEFMCSLLNNYINDRKKLKVYLREAERLGIRLLKPDIYESESLFRVTEKGEIRMGLAAINGIGITKANAIKETVSNQKTTSFKEITKKLHQLVIGRNMDILIRAGVFDSFGDRYKLWQSVKDKKKDKKDLEGKSPIDIYKEWEAKLLQYVFSNFDNIATSLEGNEYVIDSIKEIKDKKKREMAFIKIVNAKEKKELVVYYNVWSYLKDRISVGKIIVPEIKDNNVLKRISKVK